MNVLITRPEAEAQSTAQALREQGYTPVIAPLLVIEPVDCVWPEGPFNALIITSARSVPYLRKADQHLIVFAVGDKTALALREAGFLNVISAEGDAGDIKTQVEKTLPKPARLLHVTGEDHKSEPSASLTDQGFDVDLVIAYRARAVDTLPKEALAFLKERGGAVLHYSRRSSETLVLLARRALCEAGLLAKAHVAISQDAAQPLIEAGAKRIAIAQKPDEISLLRALSMAQEPIEPAPVNAPFLDIPLPSKGYLSPWAAGAVSGLLAAGLISLFFFLFQPKVEDPSARIMDLERRMEALRALEGRLQGAERSLTTLAQQQQQLRQDGINVRDQMEKARQKDVSAFSARLDAMDNAIKLQKMPPVSQIAPGVTALMAVEMIERAIQRGTPYAEAFHYLQQSSLAPDALKVLEPHAAKGLFTKEALLQDFTRSKSALTVDKPAAQEPTGWTGWFKRIVTIRHHPSHAASLTLGQIEAAVNKEQWVEVLRLYEKLPEPTRETMRTFAQNIEQRVLASQALEQLSKEAFLAAQISPPVTAQ
jgi:uroporphyrinogen-III synthase